jgi:hypothetical protein
MDIYYLCRRLKDRLGDDVVGCSQLVNGPAAEWSMGFISAAGTTFVSVFDTEVERPLTSSLDNSSRVYPFRNYQIAKFFSENPEAFKQWNFKGLSFTSTIDRKYLRYKQTYVQSRYRSGSFFCIFF